MSVQEYRFKLLTYLLHDQLFLRFYPFYFYAGCHVVFSGKFSAYLRQFTLELINGDAKVPLMISCLEMEIKLIRQVKVLEPIIIFFSSMGTLKFYAAFFICL